MRICFDMDGTIANLYAVEGWLPMLRQYDPTPYRIAETLLNMNTLARLLNRLQAKGHELFIISWSSKESTAEYDRAVAEAKKAWLNRHLRSVKWDKIEVVSYGTDKNLVYASAEDILFDDEARNRETWKGVAYTEKEILSVLRSLLD